jgi:CheY-like chemotaxis protein
VCDTGIGVSYNKQKDIFKSFVQANDTISALYGGSGLGLFISKQLLHIQGSTLELDSIECKGSTFWFDITFQLSKKEISYNSHFAFYTKSLKKSVLVSEDSKINTLLLNKLFKKWQVDFMFAINGKQLLEIYQNNHFDLILMDLQIPILDGYETTSIIRKMSNSKKALISIIALTAFSESEIFEKTERYKMNGLLSKPFDTNKLHDLPTSYSIPKNIEN